MSAPPGRRRLALLTALSLAWAFGAEWVTIRAGIRENHLLDLAWGLAYLLAGVVAVDRRPGNRTGPLLIAIGLTWFSGNYVNLGLPVVSSLLTLVNAMQVPLQAYLLLYYPGDRRLDLLERIAVGSIAAMDAIGALAYVLTFSPRAAGCGDCLWTPAPWPAPAVADLALRLPDAAAVVLAPLFGLALWRRYRRASPARRRALTPLWICGGLLCVVYVFGAFLPGAAAGFPALLVGVRDLLGIAVPVLFLTGLLSARLARGAVGDLLLQLRRPLPPGALTGLLARTLNDSEVRIAYATGATGGWVDADGVAVPAPSARPGQTTTVVDAGGGPIAVIVHDAGLDPAMVASAATAAGMAIENERLHAQVRAQLEEARASRARIVEAGDDQRRRVERDLHDGAQQRLLSLALALHTARRRVAAGDLDAVAATLDRATAELRAAIEELRELARGIHPAILSDEGLGPALRSLADRAPVDVVVDTAPDARCPRPVEVTAYFLVSEALANVAKHAPDAKVRVCVRDDDGVLRVEVSDDGPGGVDPQRGSGIRGLHDRVSALGGTLRIDSRPGHGSSLVAELPVRGGDPS